MEDRAKSLEQVLKDSHLESETSQGLLLSLARTGDSESCLSALAPYLLSRALSLGKLPDRLVMPEEFDGLRDGLRSFLVALHPFILEEPEAVTAAEAFKAVWLLWMNDQLRRQVPVSNLLTQDELAKRGGVMAVVLRALYPDISVPEASKLSRVLFWALDHPIDALDIMDRAKEAGVRPTFPEPPEQPLSFIPPRKP